MSTIFIFYCLDEQIKDFLNFPVNLFIFANILHFVYTYQCFVCIFSSFSGEFALSRSCHRALTRCEYGAGTPGHRWSTVRDTTWSTEAPPTRFFCCSCMTERTRFYFTKLTACTVGVERTRLIL